MRCTVPPAERTFNLEINSVRLEENLWCRVRYFLLSGHLSCDVDGTSAEKTFTLVIGTVPSVERTFTFVIGMVPFAERTFTCVYISRSLRFLVPAEGDQLLQHQQESSGSSEEA